MIKLTFVAIALVVASVYIDLGHASQCSVNAIGDGWCDSNCNNREHKFDGGDCCEDICTSQVRMWPCGVNGYDCLLTEPIPAWFNNTQFCYKWWPDGDGGQCGGGAPRDLCAFAGQRTPYYRDDTDGRGGGCRMQWRIYSPYAPSWFRDSVQVCYRWYADGNGGQCGAGAPAESCASVGSYTSVYRDDTDGRSGGCRMSWKLSVPNSSPRWLRGVNLCYYWYPDGDGGQCGGGASRTLCANANFWTSYYRDDTDGRSGGCRMSWGIQF